MTTIRQNLQTLQNELNGSKARLVAVSKYHTADAINEAYACGQRIFGESHVQELCAKQLALPADIQWHFIGHLQTNKVKYIASFISLIHSVDTLKLLKEIDRQAEKASRTIDCLLQIHIAEEETKFGFTPLDVTQMLDEGQWRELKHTRIVGLMCIATNTDDSSRIQKEFRTVHQLFETLKQKYFEGTNQFCELSMGMSDDYPIALGEGSTLIRIGSRIFGERIYDNHC